jgi:chaperonin GroES
MLKPLTNNLLIRPEKAPEQTDSGLHLVQHWAPENMGEIVAIADQGDTLCPSCDCRVVVPMTVKVGDTVIFPLEAGQELTVDGERFLLMKEADLLAVVEPHEVVTHG